MRILVIGASGFIGPPLVRQLVEQRHEVAALHRGTHPTPPGAAAIVGDRNRLQELRDAIARFAPEVVVDLILSSEKQARDLIETLRGTGARVVAASSMDVYRAITIFHGVESGPLQDVPLKEESELRTRLPYPPEALQRVRRVMEWVDEGYDKIAVERALHSASELQASVLRLPVIYGPGDPLRRLHGMLKRMDDRRPAILLAEDFAQWCSPRGYVDNVAAAIARASQDARAAGRTYNVSTLSVSELEWAKMLAVQAGWTGDLIVLPRERMPKHLLAPGNYAQHWTASSQKIRGELGYSEPVELEESLRRTIEWERAHPPAAIDAAQFDYAAEDAALARDTA